MDQIGGPTVGLPRAYAYAGCFLTGEQRSYDKNNSVFGDVVPNGRVGKDGGIGAWELAVRYSYLDYNDANVQGGRLSDITAGVNWRWNPTELHSRDVGQSGQWRQRREHLCNASPPRFLRSCSL